MGFKWFVFLSMNITTLPLLIVSIVGWIMALNRSDLGKRAARARRGFGLLVVAQLVMVYGNFMMSSGLGPESAKDLAKLGFLRTAFATGGLAMLIAAVTHRDAVTPAREVPADASADRSPS